MLGTTNQDGVLLGGREDGHLILMQIAMPNLEESVLVNLLPVMKINLPLSQTKPSSYQPVKNAQSQSMPQMPLPMSFLKTNMKMSKRLVFF